MNKIEYNRECQKLVSTEDIYINITKFSLSREIPFGKLLKLPALSHEFLSEDARNDESGLYLKSVFDFNYLVKSDFRHIANKNELKKYLISLSEDENWPDFNRVFKTSINLFFGIPCVNCLCDSYVINKDDFEISANVVVEREYRAYGFYLLLIWVCNEERAFHVCEWSDE